MPTDALIAPPVITPEPAPEVPETVTYRARRHDDSRPYDWCGYPYWLDGERVPHWTVPASDVENVEQHMFFQNGRIVRVD